MTFLDDVIAVKRREIDALRLSPPTARLLPHPDFTAALRGPGLSVIAEIKRRSPSKGPLAPNLEALTTARAYAEGGAAAISCLTDREFFGARSDDIERACLAGLPVLRKDFILEEIQVDESAALGASAILLIVRILETVRIGELLRHARSLGLAALVEVHDEGEVDRALMAGASIIGVNNRDLGTLVVDSGRAHRLRPHIPTTVIAVAESGVKSRDQVKSIEDAGFDAVLIGEALAAHAHPAAKLRELRGAAFEVAP